MAVLAVSFCAGRVDAVPLDRRDRVLLVDRAARTSSVATIISGFDESTLVHLSDLNLSLSVADRAALPCRGRLAIDAGTALLSVQVARDSSDSIAFTPAPCRGKRIDAAALSLGIDRELFLALCINPFIRAQG
jgi:hypothetical protein